MSSAGVWAGEAAFLPAHSPSDTVVTGGSSGCNDYIGREDGAWEQSKELHTEMV